jgi:hypothetical protein
MTVAVTHIDPAMQYARLDGTLPPDDVLEKMTAPGAIESDAPAVSERPPVAAQPHRVPRTRPVNEIIENFLTEIANHPDAQLANCELHGPVPSNLRFPGVGSGQQHLTSLRIVYRDPMETAEEKAAKPWRWQGLVDEMNKPQPAQIPEPPRKEWAHLMPQQR